MKYLNFIKGYLYYFLGINKQLREERMDMCNNCQSNKKGRCMSCGCFLNAKTSIKSQHCPKNLW